MDSDKQGIAWYIASTGLHGKPTSQDDAYGYLVNLVLPDWGDFVHKMKICLKELRESLGDQKAAGEPVVRLTNLLGQ